MVIFFVNTTKEVYPKLIIMKDLSVLAVCAVAAVVVVGWLRRTEPEEETPASLPPPQKKPVSTANPLQALIAKLGEEQTAFNIRAALFTPRVALPPHIVTKLFPPELVELMKDDKLLNEFSPAVDATHHLFLADALESHFPLDEYTIQHSVEHYILAREPIKAAETFLNLDKLLRFMSTVSGGVETAVRTAQEIFHLDFPSESEVTKQRVKFISSVLRLASEALQRDVNELAGQILGRVIPPFNDITGWYVQQAHKWLAAQADKRVLVPVGFGSHSGLKLAGGAEIASTALVSDANALLLLSNSNTVLVGCENYVTVAMDVVDDNYRVKYRLEGFHTDQITCLACDDDSKYIFTGSADVKIGVWQQSDGKFVRSLNAHTERVTGLQVLGNKLFSSSYDKTICVWQIGAFNCLKTLYVDEDWVTALCCAVPAGFLFCGTDVGTLHAWDAVELQPKRRVPEAHESDIACMCASTSHVFTGSWDETVKMWNFDLQLYKQFAIAHTDWITSLAFDCNTSTLFTGSRDSEIHVWENLLNATAPARVLTGHGSTVTGMQVCGDLLYTVSSHLRTYEWKNPVCFGSASSQGQQLGHSMEVLCVAATEDLAVCFTGAKDCLVLIWDMLDFTGTCTAAAGVLEGHTGWVNCLELCNEDKTLISGSGDHTVRLWDWNGTGECTHVLEMHTHWVVSISLLYKAPLFETVDFNGTAFMWNYLTGEQVTSAEEKARADDGKVSGLDQLNVQVGWTRDLPTTEADVVDETRVTYYRSPCGLVLAPKDRGFECWRINAT